MSESVRVILKQNSGKIRPGDVYMMNNPFNGHTHLPDVIVITPVFDEIGERIIYTVASRGHHADTKRWKLEHPAQVVAMQQPKN